MENNFNQEFEEKVGKGFELFKNALNNCVTAMSNFAKISRDNLEVTLLFENCVERIKYHHAYFNAEIAFDRDLIVKRLLSVASQRREHFTVAVQDETEKIIQEMNDNFVPKNGGISRIIVNDYLRPKMAAKKDKKPFYKSLNRLKKWEK